MKKRLPPTTLKEHQANGGKTRECGSCKGTGFKREYLHRDNGKCYRCNGFGLLKTSGAKFWPQRVVDEYQEGQRISALVKKWKPTPEFKEMKDFRVSLEILWSGDSDGSVALDLEAGLRGKEGSPDWAQD